MEIFPLLRKHIFSLDRIEEGESYGCIPTVRRQPSALTFVIRYIYKYKISDTKANNIVSFFIKIFTMVKITNLPDEVIMQILQDKNVKVKDIVSFQATCYRLQRITLSNNFWKKKYYKRYIFTHKFLILI